MNYLITGGAGFIGSHLAEHFQKAGNSVTILDSLATGNPQNLSRFGFNGKLVKADIRNERIVSKLVSKTDVVLHMAAALGVSNIMNQTLESISTNIQGSEVVLRSAARYGKRIVIASTSEIYGKNPKQPLMEIDDRVIGTPQNIRWSYSDAKAIEESMARTLNLTSGLPVTTIRFFNTVGPRQTGKYGMVVPRMVESALRGEDILVYGDGSQSRVFCHVLDAVDAVSSLLRNVNSISEVYNVGGKGEISILDLAKKIKMLINSSSEIEFVEYDDVYPVGFEDMQRRVPDIEKIKKLTGWEPIRDLNKIIIDVRDSM